MKIIKIICPSVPKLVPSLYEHYEWRQTDCCFSFMGPGWDGGATYPYANVNVNVALLFSLVIIKMTPSFCNQSDINKIFA